MRKGLCELRKARGLTQVEAAEKLQVDQTTVSKWENGEALPRADMLFRIAGLYGIKVDNIKLVRAVKVKQHTEERYDQSSFKGFLEEIWDE